MYLSQLKSHTVAPGWILFYFE